MSYEFRKSRRTNRFEQFQEERVALHLGMVPCDAHVRTAEEHDRRRDVLTNTLNDTQRETIEDEQQRKRSRLKYFPQLTGREQENN